jgi:hypothetical protein
MGMLGIGQKINMSPITLKEIKHKNSNGHLYICILDHHILV